MEVHLAEDTSLDRFPVAIRQDGLAIPDLAAVLAYLRQHRGLESLVQALGHEARQRFGPEATLSLEVNRDPEVEDPYLVLLIRPATYDASIMSRIEALRQAYAEQLASSPGWFHLTTDFRPAR